MQRLLARERRLPRLALRGRKTLEVHLAERRRLLRLYLLQRLSFVRREARAQDVVSQGQGRETSPQLGRFNHPVKFQGDELIVEGIVALQLVQEPEAPLAGCDTTGMRPARGGPVLTAGGRQANAPV
ncbi:hypothetical protein MFU01_64550 [Myxococcus fulvus]|uniref:Uncharacterized protein n=1 Tax=Myxococcus fulvus TaxID=33 RepID=A0A511TE06_MYXFU|nr:hypothetical protein MFU01_64550 [Myxococcus fulvus]